jgi:hypothetical protein
VGIVDISTVSVTKGNEINLKTVELATELMKKNGPAIYERLTRAN